MSYSNTPISRVVSQSYRVDADLGGICWNNQKGYFFAGESEPVPMREPYPAARRPTKGRRRKR